MFLGRYIMTGVKQRSFGAGSFCNTVCYLVIGKLDIEYGANLFRFDLIGQKSNRRSAGFCLIAASWKGGKTVQTVFFRKITEGKTVAEYHCFMGNACKKIADSESSISEIAFDSGFRNLSNFNRHFYRIMGCTPMEYRKKSRTQRIQTTRQSD